ncbi:MAG: hypothetical protein M1823_005982 [Watsoniomyces obsoletus]|nr:MAG: hypothetical protein M1823_005982 [Watsoniomyces obsoletus]
MQLKTTLIILAVCASKVLTAPIPSSKLSPRNSILNLDEVMGGGGSGARGGGGSGGGFGGGGVSPMGTGGGGGGGFFRGGSSGGSFNAPTPKMLPSAGQTGRTRSNTGSNQSNPPPISPTRKMNNGQKNTNSGQSSNTQWEPYGPQSRFEQWQESQLKGVMNTSPFKRNIENQFRQDVANFVRNNPTAQPSYTQKLGILKQSIFKVDPSAKARLDRLNTQFPFQRIPGHD